MKEHWDHVYSTKREDQLSWTQEIPQISLDMIGDFNLPYDASLIDVGGGDSQLAAHLLDQGYMDITVLDISERAIERAKVRLGGKSDNVSWMISDIVEYDTDKKYDLWHDRATFHFLTEKNQIDMYLETAGKLIRTGGYLLLGTFSEKGPEECSGLKVKRYSEQELVHTFGKGFKKLKCVREVHKTPFGSYQNFLFCSFCCVA